VPFGFQLVRLFDLLFEPGIPIETVFGQMNVDGVVYKVVDTKNNESYIYMLVRHLQNN